MILQILIGLIGLGLVVFVHEAGHLLVAKLVGIEVEAFSIGWGKRLAGFTFRGTEYRISLIPLGGYCKMKGEAALQQAFENDEDVIRQDEGAFYTARPWKRILVLLAGPAMNLLFAIIVLSVIWYSGFTIHTFGNRIVLESQYPLTATSGTYPATQAGLKTGDTILSINGNTISDFRDLEQAVSPNPDTRLSFTVRRPNGSVQKLSVVPALNKTTGAGRIGVYPWIDPVVSVVSGPAKAAGIQPGDQIIAVNGTPVAQSIQYQQLIDKAGSGSVALTVLRNGTRKTLPLTLKSASGTAQPDPGIRFKGLSVRTPRLNPAQAVAKGTQETFRTLALTVKGIGLLFRGVNITDAVAGPVRITYLVGEAATQGFATSVSAGFTSFFNFLALLSVVLFFMNLLPIPLLDGGQIVLSGIEGITHRPLKPRYVHRYQLVGVVIVFLLIFFAFFNDILYFVRH
jgi:regulator of sigma E protease